MGTPADQHGPDQIVAPEALWSRPPSAIVFDRVGHVRYPYTAAGAGVCKMASGNVCGNGGGDNYFWNRIR